MKINWSVRFGNLNFWMTFIPAVILLVQVSAAVFGIQLDLGELTQKLLNVANALFAILVLLGVVNDPTTKGLSDSKKSLTYNKPM